MLRLHWSSRCAACGSLLAAGTRVEWDPRTRLVTCVECADGRRARAAPEPSPAPSLDRGSPGASAEREHRRRKANREARTRARHPHVGGLLLRLCRPPQHELAFHQGAQGEQLVARALESVSAPVGAKVLHDLAMPRGYGNIDHIAIAPSGVYVIDAKAVAGKVRVARPLLGAPRLMVGRRDRSRFVQGLERQVEAVRKALAEHGETDVPVLGTLCFTRATLALLSRRIGGHTLCYRRALLRRIKRPGPLSADSIDRLFKELSQAFPRA